ncbi:hypothetical protein DMC30DRAFT_392475 [Rhodotorula diobovata]|uniref:Uncharacterized protein n=1 Tax=Rhodotorula diobovata TaxID=5288 RepID=A0A5C5FZY9_9BASI|nr:hypothetical protein DMC30DRAFT_392475 [Rhodotorula diobovata]
MRLTRRASPRSRSRLAGPPRAITDLQATAGQKNRLKRMVALARALQELETQLFELHLDAQRTHSPREAQYELRMALDNTRELVAKREREFVQAAHVWTHGRQALHAGEWNANLEQYADNQYVSLVMCRLRLEGLQNLARATLAPPLSRTSGSTLLGADNIHQPQPRGRSSLAPASLGIDGGGSARTRENTPVPHFRVAEPDRLAACEPNSRSEVSHVHSAGATDRAGRGEETEPHSPFSDASSASSPSDGPFPFSVADAAPRAPRRAAPMSNAGDDAGRARGHQAFVHAYKRMGCASNGGDPST